MRLHRLHDAVLMKLNPLTDQRRGTRDRRCFECSHWREPERWPETAQPLGDCVRVQWIMPGIKTPQMTHADDACAKFENAARSVDDREMAAVRAGLG